MFQILSKTTRTNIREFCLQQYDEIERPSKPRRRIRSTSNNRMKGRGWRRSIMWVCSKYPSNIPYIKIVHGAARGRINRLCARKKVTKKSSKIFPSFVSDCTLKSQFYFRQIHLIPFTEISQLTSIWPSYPEIWTSEKQINGEEME